MTIRDMDEEAHLETFGTGEQDSPNDDPEGLRIYLLGGFRVLVGSRAIDDVEWRLSKAKTLVKLLVLRSTGSLWIDVDAFDAAAAEAHRTRDRPPRKGDMMAKIGQPYTSGRWLVKAGNEEAFIERWTAFTQWSLNNAPGAESFVLIQDTSDPRRFLSFGAWDNLAAVTTWRQSPEFGELLGECRALCEEFEPHDYALAATPSS